MASTVQSVKNTIASNFGGAAHSLADSEHQFNLEEVPDLSGKVAIVTGGSEGIGYGCTHTLLAHGISKLFIISVSRDIVDSALDSIKEEMGAEVANKVVHIKCDLSDWIEVTKVAKAISEQTDRLDILICNAARGIMTYQVTDYGLDRHMAVNHFGHVVLTSHLLPLLKQTAEKGETVRIVTFGSNVHRVTPSDTKFASDEEMNRDLGPNAQYGRSKLAEMLYARYLARHLSPSITKGKILANSIHPGFVSTKASKYDIHEAFPVSGFAMSTLMEPFKKDQFEGCVSAMYAATKTEGTGQYICCPAVVEEGSEMSRDVELQEQLMKFTREFVSEKFREQSIGSGCPMKDY